MIIAIQKLIHEVVIKTYLSHIDNMVDKLNFEEIVLGLHWILVEESWWSEKQ